MKTGNAPLRNGDFRRVAYRRKPAQALRQQASGRFLVAAFREQARRFGTERPRPQMLVVAFDRPLDFLIEIKPPDGRQAYCSAACAKKAHRRQQREYMRKKRGASVDN